jgi:NADH-ubiquinone oxidoreductase chain 1
LAEYGSILLMCILTSIFFFGGYLLWFDLIYWFEIINYAYANLLDIDWIISNEYFEIKNSLSNFNLNSLFYSISLGLKSSIMVFIFIWVRASFPRIRFDQLMSFCWTILLPILFAFIITIPCLLYNFDAFFININLF